MGWDDLSFVDEIGDSGFFDDGSDEARRKNEQMLQLIKQMFGRPWQRGLGDNPSLFGYALEGYRQGLPLMQQAVSTVQQGGANALSALGGQGATAYRAIQDQAGQASSASAQRGVSSGLYSSTAGATADNQARYQAMQAAGGLGEGLGRLMAGQHTANAGATANALGNLAQYWTQRGRDLGNLGSQFGGLLSQYQFQPGKSPFEQVAGVAGTAAGLAL